MRILVLVHEHYSIGAPQHICTAAKWTKRSPSQAAPRTPSPHPFWSITPPEIAQGAQAHRAPPCYPTVPSQSAPRFPLQKPQSALGLTPAVQQAHLVMLLWAHCLPQLLQQVLPQVKPQLTPKAPCQSRQAMERSRRRDTAEGDL